MSSPNITARPMLTLPDAEAKVVLEAYKKAKVILEYGSGGSTVLAAEMTDKRVFSVESDKNWARMMQAWFEHSPPAKGTSVDVIWSNVGPTKKWGYPADNSEWSRYAHYPLGVWNRADFKQPDVVLVDGRFRSGCAMAAAFLTKKNIQLLVDDYSNRRRYHRIEEFLGTPRLIGRMAEFKVKPMPVPADRLLTIIQMMTQP